MPVAACRAAAEWAGWICKDGRARCRRGLPRLRRDQTRTGLSMTGGIGRPVFGYPTFRSPALICSSDLNEILHLEWRRVDFGRRVALLDPGTAKNGEGRGILLNNDAVLALRDVEGIDPKWCFTYQGQRMEAVGRYKRVDKARKVVGSYLVHHCSPHTRRPRARGRPFRLRGLACGKIRP